MKLDPLSLRLFVRVVEEGTIAAAAAREHIAPAAVSKRISELESLLDAPLLVRTNRGVTPTAAGLSLLNLARGILNELDNIAYQMREFSSGTRGIVRVLANISVITQFMPSALADFLAAHPMVQVSLKESVSPAIVKGIAENQADIGFFLQGTYPESLEIHPFRTDRLALIAPAGHPLAGRTAVRFAETVDYDWVGLHASSNMNMRMSRAAAEIGRPLKFRIRVTSYDALCLMVQAGLGIGILPRDIAGTYGKMLDFSIIELDETWAHRQLVIGIRSYETLPVAARLLFDYLRQAPSSGPVVG